MVLADDGERPLNSKIEPCFFSGIGGTVQVVEKVPMWLAFELVQ